MKSDTMKIEIVRGQAAQELLAEDAFRAQCSSLWHDCPWATMFQSPAYVATWYSVYRERYEPVLVLTRDDKGRLAGLLTLAASSEGRLVAAGDIQAEYQVWICSSELGGTFPPAALREIRSQLPRAVLRFNYLPPGTPTAWLSDRTTKPRHILKGHRRPLSHFGDGRGIAASLAKRSNKNRLRQIEKLGKVTFEQITDPKQMECVIDAIIPLHDTRHMTFRGAAPFMEDPLRRTLALELMKIPGLVHVTVLKAGDHLVTAHIGSVNKTELQLGLIAHNPRFAHYSPGKFQILFLSRMVMQQGLEGIDLTAGGDPYKERFSDGTDQVHTLALFPSRLSHAKGIAIESAKSATRSILKLGCLSPNQARLIADNLKSIRPIRVARRLFKRAAGWMFSRSETCIYSIPSAQVDRSASSNLIRRDALGDLLLYQAEGTSPSRRDFVAAAIARIEEGQHLYTHTENGRLVHCAFLAEGPSEEVTRNVLNGYALPRDSALILCLETFPADRADQFAPIALSAMLNDAASIPNTKNIFITIPAIDAPTRALVERLGFTREGSLFARTFFGFRRDWSSMPANRASTASGTANPTTLTPSRISESASHRSRSRKQPHPLRA